MIEPSNSKGDQEMHSLLYWALPPDTKQYSEEEVRFSIRQRGIPEKGAVVNVELPKIDYRTETKATETSAGASPSSITTLGPAAMDTGTDAQLIRLMLWETRNLRGLETTTAAVSEEEARFLTYTSKPAVQGQRSVLGLGNVGLGSVGTVPSVAQVFTWAQE